MFKHGTTYLAVERLIDSVWTLKFKFLENGIQIISYSRDNIEGYQNEKKLPKIKIIEGEKRIVEAVHIYKPELRFFDQKEDFLIGKYLVLNPQNIFSYKEIR